MFQNYWESTGKWRQPVTWSDGCLRTISDSPIQFW